MIIRFGYVAMSMMMEDASPSKTVTYTSYKKLAEKDPEVALNKVRRVSRENLHNCLRLLRHNKAHGVKVFRFSSKIIPLATHPDLKGWDYIKELYPQLKELGDFIKENEIRVTFHPDHFTVLNTPDEEVFRKSLIDLVHHARIFNAMKLDYHSKLVIHVGGGYKDKISSLERFVENWAKVPKGLQHRITLENDDKTYTASEVLYLCNKLQLPMVLDIHHFRCNHDEDEKMAEIIPEFINTWKNTELPPKIHVSSPKNEKDLKSHHEFIDPDDLYPFLKLMRKHNVNFDVMVEAKQKDKAMFQLVKDLERYPNIKLLGDSVIAFS
ncbi:MAG: UV DNA damage repair endonuclease UvsE [Firmicutes bacterium]|nr:UV DNA damage repair endonuclease UvsE [Bacillota bacterium]